MVVVESSADTPPEVYSIVEGESLWLSNHGAELATLEIATAEPFCAKAQDGTEIDIVLVLSNKYTAPKPL